MNIKYSTAGPPGKPNYIFKNIKLKKKSITCYLINVTTEKVLPKAYELTQ